MESLIGVLVSSVLILYFMVAESLDWAGRMEIIETKWPSFAKLFAGRKLRLVVLFFALALLGKIYLDSRHPQAESSSPPAPHEIKQSAGNCSANIAGSNNKVGNLDCDQTPKQKQLK